MLLANHNNFNTRKRTIERQIKFGPVSLQFVTIAILAAAALFYLAQSTASATRSYRQSELQQKKETLIQENEKLRVEAVRLRSLSEIQKGVANSDLQVIDKIEQ